MAGMTAAVISLTGCIAPPIAGPYDATPASSPDLGAGAGSFPRSFLIPGTVTSIHIGG